VNSVWRACSANLWTRGISLAAILTQRRRHGLVEDATSATFGRCRRRRGRGCYEIAQRQPGESSESREDPSLRLALEITATRHRTIVLPWSSRSNLQDLLSSAAKSFLSRFTAVSFYQLNNYLYSRLTAILSTCVEKKSAVRIALVWSSVKTKQRLEWNPLEIRRLRFRNSFASSFSLFSRSAGIDGVILTDRFVQDDSRPVTGGEFGLADVSDCAGFRAADPYSVSDFKAVCVLSQNDAGICARSKIIRFEMWRMNDTIIQLIISYAI